MKFNTGFTILELIIVVAIIGILAALIQPANCDYIDKARVNEGMVLASPIKTKINEFFILNKAFPSGDSLIAPTAFIASIISLKSGKITITFNEEVRTLANKTIIYLPEVQKGGELVWSCTGGTVRKSERPTPCR